MNRVQIHACIHPVEDAKESAKPFVLFVAEERLESFHGNNVAGLSKVI